MVNQELPKSPFPYQVAWILTGPGRYITNNPKRMMKEAQIPKGATVLELGCGPGFFTSSIAEAVGKDGKITSQDVQPQMIDYAKKRTEKSPFKENINFIVASSAKLPLDDNSVDFVFAAHVVEEIIREKLMLDTAKELKRIMKPKATLFVKEHRLGVGDKVINKIYARIAEAGLKQSESRKTTFAYYARYIKEE